MQPGDRFVMSSQQQPNILFLFTDQQRPDWLGSNADIPVRTPNIDALADSGVQFTNAICPSPLCAPSRAALASGFEYDRCGVLGNYMEYPRDQPTLHQRLRDQADYLVMGCGKFHTGKAEFTTLRNFSWNLHGDNLLEKWGFSAGKFNEAKVQSVYLADHSGGEPRGPYTKYLHEEGWLDEHIADYRRRAGADGPLPRNPGLHGDASWTSTFPTELPDEVYFDNWIARNGLELLDDAPADDPWFLQVNLQNPHHPWDITEEMHDWYRDPPVDFPPPVESDMDISPGTHNEIRRNYAAMVEHIDQIVGRYLEKLDERGERDQTLVVFSSDHGEMLGDYGQWQKMSPLQMSIGVPLVIDGPGVSDRDPVDDPTTILDLHSTFLEYSDVSPPESLDSRSMVKFLAGQTDRHRNVVYSGLGTWRLTFDGRYKLIRGYEPELWTGAEFEAWEVTETATERAFAEREQILYDVEGSERENVASSNPDIVRELGAEMDAFMSG
jgi:choline-sulfatase